MLSLRTSPQNRTKVPTPLCGRQVSHPQAQASGYRHNPTPAGKAPISDMNLPCVAGPCSSFSRSHLCGSSGFCVAVRGHLMNPVRQILPGA